MTRIFSASLPVSCAVFALLNGCAAMKPTAPVAAASSASGAAATAAAAPASGASAPNGNGRPVAAAGGAGPAASGVPPGTPQPATTPAAGSPPAFAVVIKDAQRIDGVLPIYQKDEKYWLELRPEDFDKPFFLSPKLATGIGESMLFGGLMDLDGQRVIEFRRIHNQVQMIALNTDYGAKAGTPEGRSVAAAFSPSLLASTPVASAPEPTHKSVLVDAGALFVNDMLGIGMQLQRTYRQGYAFDGRNSAITTIHASADSVSLQVLEHFATGSIAVAQPGAPAGAPVPSVPRTLPDPRSMFMTVHYTIARLPEQPMAARAADARIGYFTALRYDFSDDVARTPAVRNVFRWRLEKKDPSAALSEPVKPLVYVLDHTIPLKYRPTITAGILEWNKAFEKIGFKDAVQVKIQADDDNALDTLDGGASVRWMSDSSPSFAAIGPSHVDPRSGEILAANIGIEGLSFRALRAQRAEVLMDSPASIAKLMQFGGRASQQAFDPRACDFMDQGGEELGYALDVLAARDGVDPDSPEAQQYVLDFLKLATMHEVGHTLGLRHNFRASRVVPDAKLSDPNYARDQPLAGSVMDYTPPNLAAPGAPRVQPYQTTLGPYDYWAIEYAYKPIPAGQEKAELEKIASRSGEPQLAFGTDEDNYLGIDPESLIFDLGSDPIAFARKRLAIGRDLFKRQESRQLPEDQDYGVLRRSLGFALNDSARAVGVLARQIGGVRTLRDHPGTGRDPLQPVPAAEQRDALDAISRGLFAADSLVISPALQRRLAPDFQERGDALETGGASVSTDYPLPQRVLAIQRAALNQLMGDSVASRILDGATTRDAFQLSELYQRMDRDIWSELKGGGDIPTARRELQREHLNHLTGLLLRPSAASRTDTRGLVRSEAIELLARVKSAENRASLSMDARAHLKDCDDTLTQALGARLLRSGA